MPVYSYPYFNSSLSSTATLVIGARVRLKSIKIRNPNTTEVFVQVFDAVTAASVTVGSTQPKQSFPVIAGDGTNSGLTAEEFEVPIGFEGIVIAATTTPAGSSAPSQGLAVNILYHY